MNRVVLHGRFAWPAYLAATNCGLQLATLYLVTPSPCSTCSPSGPFQKLPCLLPQRLLPEVRHLQVAGSVLQIEGQLWIETLWYEPDCALRTLQILVERITPLPDQPPVIDAPVSRGPS